MGKKSRNQKGKAPKPASVKDKVDAYLQATYPASYTPRILATEMNLDYEGVKKALQHLFKEGRAVRPPRTKKGLYMGALTPETINKIEEPPVEMHDMSFLCVVDEKVQKFAENKAVGTTIYSNFDNIKKLGTPKRYTEHSDAVFYHYVTYWEADNHLYKVTFSCHEETVEIHLNASKKPLSEIMFASFHSWMVGMLQGIGVATNIMDLKITKAELNKDYKRITITPKMLEIRDLLEGSWLRIYRKYRNLHRIEVGTNFEGEQEMLDLFLNFGKAKQEEKPMDDIGGMFG